MGSHDKGTEPNRQGDGNDVLDRVRVDGDNASWSGPLVVNLVAMLVEFWMV